MFSSFVLCKLFTFSSSIYCQSKVTVPYLIYRTFLATKADLEDGRVVSQEEGEALAKREGMCFFMETSSKINLNVDHAFYELAYELKKQYDESSHLDFQAEAFRLSQGTTSISRWSSCC